MKDFFISSPTVQYKTPETTTLPALIRLNQFEKDDSSKNGNNLTFKNTSSGYLGSSNYYDFAFIINYHTSGNLNWLYTSLYKESSREVILRKKDITDRFMIIEIPDYGAQAMSPFFTDFVPHIYIEGLKLWQKYFCILKHYSKKIAYILIDRDENNLNYIKNITEENGDGEEITVDRDDLNGKKIDIRICFKNNIEETYSSLQNINDDSLHSSIILKLNSTDGKTFTGETENDLTSQFFNFGSFESEYNNLFSINDFDFITEGVIYDINAKNQSITMTHHHKMIHPSFIKSLEFEKKNAKDIARQTVSKNNENIDYFKQLYNKEKSDPSIYDRPDAKVQIILTLKESLNHQECGNIRSILLVSKSNLKDAIYSKEENFNSFDLDYNGDNYSRFNKDGYYNKPSSGDKIIYEYIPEYTSTRKITFRGTDIKKSKIKNSYPNLYRWNLDNAFEFGYDESGKITKTEYATYFIYDSGEDESNDVITASGSVSGVSFSTDNINIESEIIRENNNYQFTYSSSDKKLIFTEDKLPLSFYIKFEYPNATYNTDLKINAINRSFVIPYEVSIIDNYTLLCKVNDYFIYNDKLNYTDYNSHLNKNFLNGFEPVLFTNGIKDGENSYYGDETSKDEDFDFHLYNVDGYNNYLRDNTNYYTDSKLVNNNIVNFSSRSVEI